MPKIFSYILFTVGLIQIIFSFFYSSDIITQNNNLYQNQQEYQKLKIERQNLEKTFSDLSSIYHLTQESQNKNLNFIDQKINLK
jgi:sortase (surface protein transpeptidase)